MAVIAAEQVEAVQRQTINLDTLRSRLRERMAAVRVSGNALSRKAGLGISYVNDLLTGASRKPSLSNLAQVAAALDSDLPYLLGEQETPRAAGPREPVVPGTANVVQLLAGRKTIVGDAVRVPLYASPWPDEDGMFEMSDLPDETTPLAYEPVAGGYAVIVPDEQMAPRYSTGEKVFVNPRRPLVPGCYVVVRLKDGRAAIRQLVELKASSVMLQDIATRTEREIARAEIHTIHRITASCEA